MKYTRALSQLKWGGLQKENVQRPYKQELGAEIQKWCCLHMYNKYPVLIKEKQAEMRKIFTSDFEQL